MNRIGMMTSHTLRPLAIALALGVGIAPAYAAKYTYHGDLMDGDAPAEGAYDLRVRAFAQPGDINSIGEATELPDVRLSKGQFNVEFDLPEDADGTTWVEVAVRKAGSSELFEKLGDPQPLMKVNGGCAGNWSFDGNSGVPTNSFLGIADTASTQNLDFRVQGRRGLRLQPNTIANTLSVVAGHPSNTVVATALGGTIGGGGRDDLQNFVAENFGTVAGGFNNIAGNPFAGVGRQGGASVGGGEGNWATGNWATIPGGLNNRTDAAQSLAAGTRAIIETAHTGTFAWGDSQNVNFVSTGPNQFLVRSAGGVAFNGTPANSGYEFSIFGNDPDSGFVEVLLTPKPSLNGNTGESIEFGAGPGGAGSNDANFRITQRNAAGGFFQALTIGSDGVTSVKNGVVGNVSDARLKKNIVGIQQPLDTLLALRGHMFEYIDPAKSMNTPGPRMGFIAQEVQQTLPNWVTPNDNGYLQVSTIGFEALAVEAIRDLKTESDLRIEQLEADNATLRSQLDAIQSQLARIERAQER